MPVAVLNRTDPAPFEWLVPGLRHELVTTIIKALPKHIRRTLVPAPDRAAEVLRRVGPDDGPMRDVVAAELSRMAGLPVTPALGTTSSCPGTSAHGSGWWGRAAPWPRATTCASSSGGCGPTCGPPSWPTPPTSSAAA